MTDRSAVQGRAFELLLAGVGETLENYEQEGGRLECALEGGEEGRGTGRGFPNGLGWSQGARRYQQVAILQEAVGSGIRWSMFTSWLFIS